MLLIKLLHGGNGAEINYHQARSNHYLDYEQSGSECRPCFTKAKNKQTKPNKPGTWLQAEQKKRKIIMQEMTGENDSFYIGWDIAYLTPSYSEGKL